MTRVFPSRIVHARLISHLSAMSQARESRKAAQALQSKGTRAASNAAEVNHGETWIVCES